MVISPAASFKNDVQENDERIRADETTIRVPQCTTTPMRAGLAND